MSIHARPHIATGSHDHDHSHEHNDFHMGSHGTHMLDEKEVVGYIVMAYIVMAI